MSIKNMPTQDKIKKKIAHKKYYQDNKDRLDKYRTKYGWDVEGKKPQTGITVNKNSKEYKDHVANLRFKKNYGISLEDYNNLFEKQNGVCAICLQPEIIVQHNKIMKLSVDHCHDSKKVRGLLCGNCNRGLGHFRDSINLLEKSIEYLKQS